MSVKEVVQVPSNILRNISINTNLKEGLDIAKDLIDTLNKSKVPGAGLAAPQIGINKNVFIARDYFIRQGKEQYENTVYINPEIIHYSPNKVLSLEGCLSIKDTYGYVERAKSIKIKYINSNGEQTIAKIGGYSSKIIQHEYDHLLGVLFTDKLVNNKNYTEKEIDEILNDSSN